MMKLPMFVVLVYFLSGCTSISNLSKDGEFSSFVDNKIALKRQVLICKDQPLKTEGGNHLDYELVYNVNSIETCAFGKTIGILPIGSRLKIMKIEKHNVIDVESTAKIYFLGTANLPNGKSIEFYYLYGFEGFYGNQPW